MGFSRLDVDALSAALGEPDWVLERRLEAWNWFEKMELPGEKEEPWRYTNLARLRFSFDGFSAALPKNSGEQPVSEPEFGRAGLLVQNGPNWATGLDETRLAPDLAGTGVIFTDLHSAIEAHPDLVRPHLFTQVPVSSHIFSALHLALFSGGCFLYVPRGVSVELPFEARYCVQEPGSALFPHSLVVLEEGAEACFIERFTSARLPAAGLCDAATEVVAGQAARAFIGAIQDCQKNVWHFHVQRNAVARDVNLKSLVVAVGGSFSRTEAGTALRGEGSSVEMLGLYLASAGQHFDFRTLQDHAAPHCTSDLLFKGALREDARAVYSGLIHVRPEGRETDAYQTNRNLVLSDHAKANSKPELEIENNDVRCSHAASVGQIDENEVFYLQSRGIDREAAEQLIVSGFFQEVLGRVSRPDVRDMVSLVMGSKL